MSKAADLANLIGNINAGGGGVNRNFIVNGAMNVSQRTTSTTGFSSSTAAYVTDRFFTVANNYGTYTLTQETDSPDDFQHSFKIDCTTADASPAASDYLFFHHRLEGQDLQILNYGSSSAKTMTLSFYVKSNKTGNGSVGFLQTNNSFKHQSHQYTINSANTWERKSVTIVGDTSGVINDTVDRGFEIEFFLGGGTTYTSGSHQTTWTALSNGNRGASNLTIGTSTDDFWSITGIQLEVGQNPTEFEHEPIERTLLKCERYYQRWQAGQTYDYVCNGSMASDTRFFGMYQLSPDMRDDPTMNFDGTYKVNAQNGDMDASNFNLNRATKMNVAFYCDTTDANRVGNGALFRAGSDADAFIEFISEL